jgi:hypothetical protein
MTKKHLTDLQSTLNAQYIHIQSEPNAVVRVIALNTFTSIYNRLEVFCTKWNAQFDANRFHAAVFGGKS